MPEFDVTKPSIARVYDFWLGGKDNFAADRELGEKILAQYPPTAELARENKQFLTRAVSWVASQGIGQYIDLGAGLPTSPSTLETAREAVPDARVAFVDNDPVAAIHLHALLASGTPGVTVMNGDVRDVDAVLAHVSRGIDMEAPAGLIMGALLHFFPASESRDLIARYVAALAPGSYVIVSVGRNDGEVSERFAATYAQSGPPIYTYTAAELTTLFGSLEVVPPGFTEARVWRPGQAARDAAPARAGGILAGVCRTSTHA
jgi:O-methyltransferase involved in polyketide biosynthesis